MKKADKEPKWIDNLRLLMGAKGFNPRSLSLKAGLNPTAVRDMLEGRAKFPRYDTVESLAQALEVTPAQLMGGATTHENPIPAAAPQTTNDEDLDLLTEIITRLQEVAEDHRHKLEPSHFAAMVSIIYKQMLAKPAQDKASKTSITNKIQNLIDYETLRRRTGSQ